MVEAPKQGKALKKAGLQLVVKGECRKPSNRKLTVEELSPRTTLASMMKRFCYPRSASASSFSRLGLCLSFLACFLFSARFTGGGVPSTARAAAFTALVAVNFLSFFFFGTLLF